MTFRYFSDVATTRAEEGDRLIVDARQCYGCQLSGGKDHQRPGLQRDASNQRSVLLHFATVTRIDLNTLQTTADSYRYSTHSPVHGP